MKKNTIILAIILVALFLSCEKTGNNLENGASEPAESETESALHKDGLDGFDFGGYAVRMLTGHGTPGETKTLNVEEENGDKINDAIYRRNREIEQRFNVILAEVGEPKVWEILELIKKSIASDSDDYDLAMMIDREAFSLICSGKYFYSMDELPHVNLDQPWWDQNARKMLSIGGRNYFTYGAESLPYFEYMYFLVFNKEIIQSLGLENPYDLVRSGKWTIDKMYEMAAEAQTDLDGNGIYDERDRLGIVHSVAHYFDSFYIGDNVLLIEKDDDDIPYFNAPGNQKLFSILEKLYDYYMQGYGFDMQYKKAYPEVDAFSSMNLIFADNNVLFVNSSIKLFADLRAFETDIGILPYPKLDEVSAGTAYGARVISGMPLVVPSTNPNPERASVILEALSCASQDYVIPAYYDIVLKEKSIRDIDSEEMLDMMYNNRYIDMGDVFFPADVRVPYDYCFINKRKAFVSETERIAPLVQKLIDNAVETFTSNN